LISAISKIDKMTEVYKQDPQKAILLFPEIEQSLHKAGPQVEDKILNAFHPFAVYVKKGNYEMADKLLVELRQRVSAMKASSAVGAVVRSRSEVMR